MAMIGHRTWFRWSMVAFLFIGLCPIGEASVAADSQLFPETGKTASGAFLDYWRANGGLDLFGLPISDAQNEVSPSDGQTYLTQWFERFRLELHGDQPQLGNLGRELRATAVTVDPDFQRADVVYNAAQPKEAQRYFDETGHNLRFQFLDYWNANGGIARFGLPISEEHQEAAPETGNIYTMQWFERARFEYHPESGQVLLGLLGKQIKASHGPEYTWKIGVGFNGLAYPQGVALDGQGFVYVSDTDNNRIQKYDGNGHFVTRWGITGNDIGQFRRPKGIAVDSAGNVFIVDAENHRVQKFNSNGVFILQWGVQGSGNGQFAYPERLAVDGTGNVYVADTAANQIQKFDGTGQFLLKWGKQGNGDGQFDRPDGISIDGTGNVYVVDTHNNRIEKFDPNGRFLLKWAGTGTSPAGITTDAASNLFVGDASGHMQKYGGGGQPLLAWGSSGHNDGQFDDPHDVAVDGSGNVYVADLFNSRIEKFDGNGRLLLMWGGGSSADGQFDNPTGVAMDAAGNLYVADTWNNRVQKFDASGRFLLKWGSEGAGDGQFGSPGHIAIDRAGTVYVADTVNNRVQKFDANGRFLLKWGSTGTGDGQFAFSRDAVDGFGIAVDGSGSVYIADTANNRVQKFDANGTLLTKWGGVGGGDGQFSHPYDLAVDGAGNVYVTDGANHRVQKFDPGGRFLLKWGGEGTSNGQFQYPAGIAVDGAGNVYVVETGNASSRIQKFDSNGQFLGAWGTYGRGDGQLRVVFAGLAADSAGNITVADNRNNRIEKFRQR